MNMYGRVEIQLHTLLDGERQSYSHPGHWTGGLVGQSGHGSKERKSLSMLRTEP